MGLPQASNDHEPVKISSECGGQQSAQAGRGHGWTVWVEASHPPIRKVRRRRQLTGADKFQHF
jgi:hypothetical protein